MPVKHLAGDIHLNLKHNARAPRYAYASMPGHLNGKKRIFMLIHVIKWTLR